MDSDQLVAVKSILAQGRELVASGWLNQSGYAQGLDEAEHEDFSRAWGDVYQPAYRPPATAVDHALKFLAETVYEDELPAGIPPIVILSNWNERPERTQAQAIAAYDKTIARVHTMIEADRG